MMRHRAFRRRDRGADCRFGRSFWLLRLLFNVGVPVSSVGRCWSAVWGALPTSGLVTVVGVEGSLRVSAGC